MSGLTIVAVPFRVQPGIDRADQLQQLLERLAPVHGVVVVVAEQTKEQKFHRGALMNAAYRFAQAKYDNVRAFIAHDCDLIPDDAMLALYTDIRVRPFMCLAGVPGCTNYSTNPSYVGGVTRFAPAAFERCNGFPIIDAHGWGGEDDELRRRAVTCGVPIARNVSVGTFANLEHMNLATKLAWLRCNPGQKNMRKWELAASHQETWDTNGLRGDAQPTVVDVSMRGSVDWINVRVPGDHDGAHEAKERSPGERGRRGSWTGT